MTRTLPQVKVLRYSDPDRLSLAKTGAVFLGKTDEGNTKRPLNMLKMKHKSIFRGEHVRFEFVTSKVVYDHLVTYTTANVRACAGLRANRAGDFVTPLEIIGTEWEEPISAIGKDHRDTYDALIRGIDPETKNPIQKIKLQAARSIAPMSVNLHYIIEFNFLTLMEAIFPQRIWEPGAQADTREVVELMWALVYEQDPELWMVAYDLFGPETIAWEKARNKLKKDNPELFVEIMEKYGQLSSMWK